MPRYREGRSHETMRRTTRLRVIAGWILACVSLTSPALADPPREQDAAWSGSRGLLQRFGTDVARRLIRGGDTQDPAAVRGDILRGIDRSVALGTDEGILLVVQLLEDPRIARNDAAILLAATRALAPFAEKRPVTRALTDVVLSAPSVHPQGRQDDAGLAGRDPERRAKIELARDTAAIALARSGDDQAVAGLLAAARRLGPAETAALKALAAFPPRAFVTPPILTPEVVLLAAETDDLRGGDSALEASTMADRTTRLVGLAALGALGQRRARATLEAAADDTEPEVREAAVRALIDIGATGVASRVRKLIEDDSTKEAGIALALRVSAPEVTGALAARVRVSSDATLRRDAIVALGRQDERSAEPVLVALLEDAALQGDAAEALARSPSESTWDAILAVLSKPEERRLGARMAALRARTLGDLPPHVRHALVALSRSADPKDRAVAAAALILTGEIGPRAALLDPDPRVRRAAVLSVDVEDPDAMAELSRRFASEKDPLARRLMAGRLGAVSSLPETVRELVDHVRDSDPLAPIGTLSLARIAEEPEKARVAGLLRSFDPLIRAHAARGLGESHQPWALGLLAEAYENEVDVGARRGVALALAARTRDVDAPLRAHELRRASLFDPEESIRTIAERALRGLPPPQVPEGRDAVWLRVLTGRGAPAGLPIEGLLVRADGLALPIALDEDGYALIPAPRGPSRLVLAPRLHSYEGVPHGE